MKSFDLARRHGFTLVEMLTVVAIFGLVAIYVGRILAVNEQAYHTVENTSESQQNLRVFGELVEDNLRHAGMMVPRGLAVCGRDFDNAPDVLYVSDAAAIDPRDDTTSYAGATVSGGVTNLNVGASQTLTLTTLIIEPSPPSRPAYDTDGDGVADSDFRENAGVIIYDSTSEARGNACGTVTDVDVANSTITVTGTAAMAAGAGTALRAVPANEFRISGAELQWNGIALADDIEDFQVGYVFDLDGDNVIDTAPDELRSFSTSGTGSTAFASSALAANQMREIAVGIVARARRADPNFSGQRQALLNRAAVTTPDGFRRRTFQTRVLLRNLAMRIS
jgi:prepilin-type N-terminal cleavage/methylation domain-containing protein